ncbi:MAG TPA: DUF4287 domain-containing protein [Arenimonas sp.]|nr:DUF4287 domain-containing protein [Arenimonas sp.]
MDLEKALATQLANIEKRSGKTRAELAAAIAASGLAKHGELVAMLKSRFGLGHGDANTLVHVVRKEAGPAPAADVDALDAIYAGDRAPLRVIHEKLMREILAFGPFETAAKKAYVSLRRKKQFAMLGPGTKTLLEIGLNSKKPALGADFTKLPPGGMCQFKRRIASADEIDAPLLAAIRAAYDEAG